MNFFINKINYIIFCLFISFLITTPIARAGEHDKLIILDAFSVQNDIYANISINGLVKNGQNFDILVYINGEYKGLANISQSSLETSSFSFDGQVPYQEDPYEILLFSKNNLNGVFSEPVFSYDRKIAPTFDTLDAEKDNNKKEVVSDLPIDDTNNQDKNDNIDEKPQPPILSSIIFLTEGKITIPKIIGFTKNNTSVNFYLDGVYHGKIKKISSDNKAATFEYTITEQLTRGEHLISAVAINDQGVKSSLSNILSFSILEPKISESSQDDTCISCLEGSIVQGNQDVSKVVDKNTQNTSKNSGETGWLNLVIFVVFLTAVLIWIFLINRELSKKSIEPEIETKKPKNE